MLQLQKYLTKVQIELVLLTFSDAMSSCSLITSSEEGLWKLIDIPLSASVSLADGFYNYTPCQPLQHV